MDSRPRFSEIDGVGVGRIGFSMDWGGGGSDFRWTGGGSIQVFDGRQVSPHPKSMYRLLSGGGFRWTMVEAGGSFN